MYSAEMNAGVILHTFTEGKPYVNDLAHSVYCSCGAETIDAQWARISPLHRGAFCQSSFRWIYCYGSNKSTGKGTGKLHLCECMELKNVFNKKAIISSIVKVPFSKNIHSMTQCPPNPGFSSIKVQNVDFLKKALHRQYFFLFPYVLLTFYHHLRAKLGIYIALCIFLNF